MTNVTVYRVVYSAPTGDKFYLRSTIFTGEKSRGNTFLKYDDAAKAWEAAKRFHKRSAWKRVDIVSEVSEQ